MASKPLMVPQLPLTLHQQLAMRVAVQEGAAKLGAMFPEQPLDRLVEELVGIVVIEIVVLRVLEGGVMGQNDCMLAYQRLNVQVCNALACW